MTAPDSRRVRRFAVARDGVAIGGTWTLDDAAMTVALWMLKEPSAAAWELRGLVVGGTAEYTVTPRVGPPTTFVVTRLHDEPADPVPYRWLYAGLIAGMLAQVAVIAEEIVLGNPWSIPANVTALVICAGALWLIRSRRKSRGR